MENADLSVFWAYRSSVRWRMNLFSGELIGIAIAVFILRIMHHEWRLDAVFGGMVGALISGIFRSPIAVVECRNSGITFAGKKGNRRPEIAWSNVKRFRHGTFNYCILIDDRKSKYDLSLFPREVQERLAQIVHERSSAEIIGF
jgi:hypothetical protein